MDGGTVLLIVLGALGAMVLWGMSASAKATAEKKQKITDALLALDPQEYWISSNLAKSVAIAKDMSSFHVIDQALNTKTYSGSDIVSVELSESGHVVTKTSGSRSVGGALVGNMIAGPVGAIIGGSGGKTSSQSKDIVDDISVKIMVQDVDDPNHVVQFCESKTAKGSGNYKLFTERANKCLAIFKILIEKNKTSQMQPGISSESAVSQLEKLGNMLEKGLITAEEFAAQKKVILGT